MFGTVINVSKPKGIAAVFTGVAYSILKVPLPINVEIGDLIDFQGDIELGSCNVRNKTKGDNISIIVQQFNISSGQVREQFLLS